ncbi:MAG: AMP-binding protein, partial [Sulfuricurvum sp.]|nr:AMP-binding protein [Sulfuricurvum sp.]
MHGYHNKSEETDKTIQNGWLHTGDLAYIDEEGYIFIKSRQKELFKTSTGKYISAISIEHHLTHSKWVDYAIIIAENKPYVTALIFLDPLMSSVPFADYVSDQKTSQRIAQLINRVNKHFNAWEQIQKYTLISTLPTIENHILTPSMKISRNRVYSDFSTQIDAMYQSHNPQHRENEL